MEVYLIAVAVGMLLTAIILGIKNEVTFHNLEIISDAIEAYEADTGEWRKGCEMFLKTREYDALYWNLFDWGYKNILPPEDFALIEPYIKKRGGNDGEGGPQTDTE